MSTIQNIIKQQKILIGKPYVEFRWVFSLGARDAAGRGTKNEIILPMDGQWSSDLTQHTYHSVRLYFIRDQNAYQI